MIEISADSRESFDDAIVQGINQASKTVNHLRSAWVKDQQVLLGEGPRPIYRVHLKVTFELK
jgi:flavin-binding protein dodecin